MRRRPDLLALALLFTAVTAAHLVWNAKAQRVPTFDQAAHLMKGMAYADAMASGRFFNELWSVPANYPPLFQVILGIGTSIVGPATALGLYVNLFALAIIMLSTYALGVSLAGRRVGLVSAIIVALFPGSAVYLREALQETYLTAFVAASLALLVATHEFGMRWPSIALGLCLGLGMLVKPTFAIYLWLPIICLSGLALWRSPRSSFANLFITASLALAISALWYIPQIAGVLTLSNANRFDAIALGQPVDIWRGFLAFWRTFALGLTSQLGQYLALAALAVGAFSIFRLWPLYAMIIGTWLLLVAAVVFRDDKYLLATLPALAILIADLLERFPPGIRRTCTALVLAAQAYAFVFASYGWPERGTIPMLEIQSQYGGVGGGEPSLPQIVAAMTRDQAPQQVALIPNTLRMNANTLAWQAKQKKAPLAFNHISYSGYFSAQAALRRASMSNWVLLKTGEQGNVVTVDLAEILNKEVRTNPTLFSLVGTWPLADGSQAEVYRVTGPHFFPARDEEVAALIAQSEPSFRDVTFGDRYKLLGITMHRKTEGFWDSQGITFRIAWEALRPGPLDRLVAFHLVDDAGKILSGANYAQYQGTPIVDNGAKWIDEVAVQNQQLVGVTGVALGLYHQTEPLLQIDRGPRDWGDSRLRIPLPPINGRETSH